MQLCSRLLTTCLFGSLSFSLPVIASDHGDPFDPPVIDRPEGAITDAFYFKNADNLVMIFGFMKSPECVAEPDFDEIYYRINFDWDTPIETSANADTAAFAPYYGGYVTEENSKDIKESETFEFWNDGGEWKWQFENGLLSNSNVNFVVDKYDDPFAFISFDNKNVMAAVITVPLVHFTENGWNKMIVWADTQQGPKDHFHQIDLNGRAIRSMLSRNETSELNYLPPSLHVESLRANSASDEAAQVGSNFHPDVIILDLSQDTHFPNGRHLEDDVVQSVCGLADCDLYEKSIYRAWPNPRSGMNDKPFLTQFPYLAEPHEFSCS